MYNDISVIICCAGMGTRLGIGTTKSLISIDNLPIIQRQVSIMKDIDDVRVVVGYQGEDVINSVNAIRKDIMYAFNYDYQNTGEADSLKKAAIGLKEYVVIVDGDLLIDEDGFHRLLAYPAECLGICDINSEEPIYATIEDNKVVTMNETSGLYEYSGIAKIKSSRLKDMSGSVYETINKLLPIEWVRLETRDIDTPDDYDRAVKWVREN